MPSYLFCFILYFHEIIRKFFHKEKLLQFLVILVTLGIYSFLVLLLSDNFTLPCDHIPQVFFFSFFSSKIYWECKWDCITAEAARSWRLLSEHVELAVCDHSCVPSWHIEHVPSRTSAILFLQLLFLLLWIGKDKLVLLVFLVVTPLAGARREWVSPV